MRTITKTRFKWRFQEWDRCWTLWGFGWTVRERGGWSEDELEVYVGPLRFRFASWEQCGG